MARDRAARPEARRLRLFVAVDVPDAVRRGVDEAMRPWHGEVAGARWVKPENWHVTLKFLGSVYPRLVDWVRAQVATAAAGAQPFETAVTWVGAFPSARRARVLWAGLDDSERRFGGMAGALDGLLEREFAPEKRGFTPHLTLARFNQQGPLPEGVVDTDVLSEPFGVEELVLYRSYLQRPAARYEAMERFPLGRAGA